MRNSTTKKGATAAVIAVLLLFPSLGFASAAMAEDGTPTITDPTGDPGSDPTTGPTDDPTDSPSSDPTDSSSTDPSDTPTGDPTDPPAPKWHLLVWHVPGGPGSLWNPPQVLVDHVLTDVASLDQLDDSSKLLCGETYQFDFENNSPTTDSLVAGGVLYGPGNPPEDHAYGALGDGVNPWKVVTEAACPPPPPTDVCKNIAGDQATVPAGFTQDGENCIPVPTECTTSTVDSSVWTTEDGAPTTGADGIVFSTPGASDKVNYFGRLLNVPFSGITGGSYTVKNTGGPIAAYDFEVWQNGTSSFATIVWEAYVNGLTGSGTSGDGAFHTYVINGSSLVWNTKIATGEGSQGHPVTLTRMQELFPAAKLIRAGLGQGKNNAGSLSTVSSFTDPACGHTVFPTLTPPPTEPPVTPPPVVVPPTTPTTPTVILPLAATDATGMQTASKPIENAKPTSEAGNEFLRTCVFWLVVFVGLAALFLWARMQGAPRRH